jgi:hypothetical protein
LAAPRIVFIGIFIFISFHLSAQDSTTHVKAKKVVQFSGLVVGGDSLYGIPGVSIYVPKGGRGTFSSAVGYFSLPVLEGDSVVIKSLGYKEKNFIIPDNNKDNKLSVIVELLEDTLLLPAVEIFPWPTEQIFKEAFLSLKLPTTDIDNMHKNLNEQVMKRMMYNMDPDGNVNHKYYIQQQIERQEKYKSYYPTLNLINPFAWTKFIESLKKGEHKNNNEE